MTFKLTTKMNIIKRIKSINWEWEWSREGSILVHYIIIKAWTTAPKRLAGHVKQILAFNKDNFDEYFVSVDDFKRCGEIAYSNSTKNGFSKMYEKMCNGACAKLINASKQKPKKDMKGLLEHYQEYVNAYIGILHFVSHIRLFNRIGEAKLKEFINSKIKNPEEQTKAFSILSATTRKNAFSDFYDLMNKAYEEKKRGNTENTKKVNELIDAIAEMFKWVPVGYGDEPEWARKDIEKQLNEFKPIKDVRVNKKPLIQKLKPTEEILRLIDAIDLMVYYKDYLRRVCNLSHYYSRPLFIELGNKFGLSLKEIKTLLPEEIFDACKNKKQIKPRNSNMLFFDNGKLYNLDYDENLLNELFSRYKTEIKGTIANPGKATGRVVIMKGPNDLKKEHNGCVLVCLMTTPDLTPAIKKCRAIITDEGGITSHAAIVSRELGIPCIIGTKIATKVLKDGDIVEVDANKEIIRKIKSGI